MKAPKTWKGKQYWYGEIFRSRPYPTEKEAQWKLDRVKEFHSPEKGWLELDSHIERSPEGYVAVRHQAIYK